MRDDRTPSFAFIVHPRDEADIRRARCLSLLRRFSSDDADFIARALALPPMLLGEVTVGFSPFRGQLVTITCLPPDVVAARGRREIDRAVDVALELGASVIGLGALTAPATAAGARLVDRVPSGVAVTNGNAYTAAVLAENVLAASGDRVHDGRSRVAVVGCTGSVGAAVSRLLSARGYDLVLVGRTAERARRCLADLAGVARFSGDVRDAAAADVVLLLTNSPSARLHRTTLREGTVVIDAAEPPSMSAEDVRAWGPRIAYARGGRVRIPGYRCTYDFGLDVPDETFACLAETYLFLREGIREHSVGSPKTALAERLARVSHRHGVRASPLAYSGAGAGPTAGDHRPTGLEGRQREMASPR